MLVVIILGSPSDSGIADRIKQALASFGIPSETRVSSAHKTPDRLLEMLRRYEEDSRNKVFITVAGRSNALSGMVDAQVTAPVIACPPHSDNYAGNDLWSSLRMPSGVAPAVVLEPENAALLAAKMLGLASSAVRDRVREAQEAQRRRLYEADASKG